MKKLESHCLLQEPHGTTSKPTNFFEEALSTWVMSVKDSRKWLAVTDKGPSSKKAMFGGLLPKAQLLVGATSSFEKRLQAGGAFPDFRRTSLLSIILHNSPKLKQHPKEHTLSRLVLQAWSNPGLRCDYHAEVADCGCDQQRAEGRTSPANLTDTACRSGDSRKT